jgi:hypothetical protein
MVDTMAYTVNFPVLQLPAIKASESTPQKIAYDMQRAVDGLDYLCMPPICGTDGFEKAVSRWCTSAEEDGRGGVPQIDMAEGSDILSKKLATLAELSDTGLFGFVSVKYANPDTHPTQYAALWSFRDRIKAVINCSEVPPQKEKGRKIGSDTELTLIEHGFDSISRKKHTVSPKLIAKWNHEPVPKDLGEIDEFIVMRHDAAAAINGVHWIKSGCGGVCTCPVCRNRPVEEIVDEFAYLDNREISKPGLRYFSQLHDHQSDQSSMQDISRHISDRDMKTYVADAEDRRNNLQG